MKFIGVGMIQKPNLINELLCSKMTGVTIWFTKKLRNFKWPCHFRELLHLVFSSHNRVSTLSTTVLIMLYKIHINECFFFCASVKLYGCKDLNPMWKYLQIFTIKLYLCHFYFCHLVHKVKSLLVQKLLKLLQTGQDDYNDYYSLTTWIIRSHLGKIYKLSIQKTLCFRQLELRTIFNHTLVSKQTHFNTSSIKVFTQMTALQYIEHVNIKRDIMPIEVI